MKTVDLGEVVDFIGGGTPSKSNKSYWNGNIPWASVKDFGDELTLRHTAQSISKEGVENSATRIIRKGTVIIPTRMALGKAVINHIDVAINQDLKAVIPRIDTCSNFLKWYFLSSSKEINRLGAGATVKGITIEKLKRLQYPRLHLEEQKRIAAILDDVDESIRLRKASIDALDELIQSTFISMFGDPVTNPMGWDVGKLGDHTSKIGSGSTPRGGDKSYKLEGIPLVRSLNVHNGEFRYKRLAFIDEEQAKRLKNVILQTNDVLLNITGASVARVCRVPEQIASGRVNQHVAIIRPTKKISPVYLERVLLNSHMKAELLGIGESGGATRQAITKDQILKIEIPIPSLEKQLKFSTAVESTEEQKAIYTHQLKELENLFGSLQQRAFKGEL